MSIAVFVLTKSRVARNNSGVARQETNKGRSPKVKQLAVGTAYSSVS